MYRRHRNNILFLCETPNVLNNVAKVREEIIVCSKRPFPTPVVARVTSKTLTTDKKELSKFQFSFLC